MLKNIFVGIKTIPRLSVPAAASLISSVMGDLMTNLMVSVAKQIGCHL